MLYYSRIDISEEIDPLKSHINKEYIIFHYWFFNHGFKFQDSVCNGCHDLTMLSVNLRILLLSLFKMLIIVVSFITLANLKQLAD